MKETIINIMKNLKYLELKLIKLNAKIIIRISITTVIIVPVDLKTTN
jgi:hypothetical protein